MNSVVRKWGEQIIRSRQYAAGIALIIAFVSFFNLPIGWLSTVIIALVTLQNGSKQGLIVTAWAMLPAVAMLYLRQYGLFINIFLLHYLIVWVLASVLRKHNSWINVLQAASLIGIISVIGIYFFAPDLQSWLVSQLTLIAGEFKNIHLFSFRPAELDAWIKYLSLLAVGLVALAVVITNLMTLFLARLWQSIAVPQVNIQKECLVIRVHYLASVLLLVVVGGLFINNTLFLNIFLVALIPFAVSGLSLLHAYFATKKNNSMFMFIFYVLFILLSPYIMILLAFMAVLDSFINIRKRFVIDNAVLED